MALTVTTVNGGQGRVVLGANGRPAHVIELGPIYIRVDIGDGFDQVEFPAGGSLAHGSIGAQTMMLYTAGAMRAVRGRRAAYATNCVIPGGLALGVPA